MLLPAIDKADISPGVQMAATAHNTIHVGDASVPVLTNDSQIGSDLRVWADEDDRTDFDQQR